jgi:uncharacterized protein YjbI with pentapeptide repeats
MGDTDPMRPKAVDPVTSERVDDARLGRDEPWYEFVVTADLAQAEIVAAEITNCVVEHTSFIGAAAGELEITNSLFDHCDLSGADLRGATLRRVHLRNCRLSGADLSHARLEDVTVEDSRLDGVNLRMSRGARVLMQDCQLTDADFYAAEIEHLWMLGCDLAGIELSKSRLTGARLQGSRLEGLRGASYLRSAAIDSTQILPLALPLLAELGITIDDDPEEDAAP